MKTIENIKNALNSNPSFELYTNEGNNQGAMKVVNFRGNNSCGLSIDGTSWVTGYNFENLVKEIAKSDWIQIRTK